LYIEYLKEMGHTPDDSSTFQNPGRTKMVKDTMTGIVKLFRETKQKQAAPIRYKLVRRIIDELGDSKREILYKTLVSVAFDTLMRRSELVNIKVAHLEFDDLDGTVELPFSKTDQTGEGSRCYLSPTSVELIKSWLKVSGIRRGLLFRSLYNGDHKLLPSMNVDKVAKIFKEIGRRLELNPEEIKSISGHSTRVGAAQELMENGATLPQLMHAGDWKSAEMPIRYTQGVRARQSAVANLHRKMNDDKDSE
jgi:integrase